MTSLSRIGPWAMAILMVIAQAVWAEEHDEDEDEEEFEEAFIFFELNDTDGDLGIHAKIDGDAWKSLEIEDPNERSMLKIRVKGRLRRQGLTEIFFESAEPTFDELAPEVFFARFPEGTYEIEGLSLEGEEIESETEITHLLPAAPEPSVNGFAFVEDCDEDVIPAFDRAMPVTITWDHVTMSHATLGRTNEPIVRHNYEVVVEIDETPWVAHAVLPPDATSYQVPAEILALGDEIKYEVLVREESFNQSATESCFEVFDL